MDGPWFDHAVRLFFAAIVVGVAVIWIKVLVEVIRHAMPMRKQGGERHESSGGLSESVPGDIAGLDSGSSESGGSGESGDYGSGL